MRNLPQRYPALISAWSEHGVDKDVGDSKDEDADDDDDDYDDDDDDHDDHECRRVDTTDI